jgi:hypothetical protein
MSCLEAIRLMPLRFIKKLRDFFSIPNNTLFYGILKPCMRCVYQRVNEPVLIFSMYRGPRIILFHNEIYLKEGNCVGYELCGRCFEQVSINDNSLSCKWKRIR